MSRVKKKRGLTHADHARIVQRFSVAMARCNSIEHLTVSMLAAVVETMNELSAEQVKTLSGYIENDQIRVLK